MTSLPSRRERILARLQELGEGPKRSLGQNFLISDQVVDRILFAVRSEPFSALIEVGPGLGAITEDLLNCTGTLNRSLTLIELDRRFAQYWRERASQTGGPKEVIEADALQVDWSQLKLPEQTLFVSNLPYQISSSLVIERCLAPAGISRMILMFQKEVAQRIAARAATKEYGLLTVIAQTFWETQTVCDAGPRDFYPPPNVASRVLQFRRREVPWIEAGQGTAEGFLSFVKAAYSHRRKLLLRNLESGYLSHRADAAALLQQAFGQLSLLPTARAEELEPGVMVQLYLQLNLLLKTPA
jgi:16S rRNA (adenine1518-N6/adenine1519-N6)-dimethyltransferase